MFIRPFWKVNRVLDCRIFETDVFHSEIVVAKTNNWRYQFYWYNIATCSNERVLYM